MSLLDAVNEEQREILKALEEEKKQERKGEEQNAAKSKNDAPPLTIRFSDNKPSRGAMSTVYGRARLPDPLIRAAARRNSASDIFGGRPPQSPSSRGRPGSPGTSLLSPTYTNQSRGSRLGSVRSLSEGRTRSHEGPHRRGILKASLDDDEDDDVNDEEKSRGRGRMRSMKASSASEESESQNAQIPARYKAESMMEPTLTVTGPDGEKALNRKTGVHPNTNFDQGGASGVSTPINSDTEADFMDIRRAQKMALTISPIHSTPEAHRVIRQIVRGQYSMFQREAEQGLRRQRVYLVATDLSEEAAYALEWTIGTVLRDGDTLLAVYAVDEETGTGGETSSVGIGEGASAVKDTASIVGSFSQGPDAAINPFRPSVYSNAIPNPPTPDLSVMSKSERERYHAASKVSDRCVKLLRKTRLQVRVVVEVFHCKSPKHMITEVIDFLEPTLVILGSRGRSALKGPDTYAPLSVLLGSFSNYLVTKSSVPVMVARKRLKKHSKYRSTNVRLSNVITNPNHTSSTRFAHARVDEFDKVRPGSVEAERLERRKKKKEQELQEALALIPR
ncbi:MAG: hypothetical protein Q9165_004750 [Trypethelium subeluteriae]